MRFSCKILSLQCILSLFAMASAFQSANAQKSSKTRRPNIIYILADDMGYSDIGCYGSEIQTPNIDRLAAGGIKLRSFYNNARCCPTRASLLTGQYPHTVGMGLMVTMPNAKVEPGSYQGYLDDRYPTIAEDLQHAGYHTYMSGKWHVGESPAYWPLKRGFEHYFGLISGASSYYEIVPEEKGKRRVVLDDKDYDIPQQGFYMTDAITDHAVGYLNDQVSKADGKPFFLYVAYTAPHYPLHAPEADVAKYEKLYEQGWDITRANRYKKMRQLGLLDQRYPLTSRPSYIGSWDTISNKKTWVRKMAVYAAMVDRLDQNIGRLIDALKKNGQINNTLIVFLSDNGGSPENVEGRKLNNPAVQIGERGSYVTCDVPWANVSNTPFKKYKSFLHEGGMITPCIVSWPAQIKSRPGYSNEIGFVVDLLPTALELAGAKADSLPGKSLAHVWNGQPAKPRTYFWEHLGNKAMRQGDWKLVKDMEDPGWELYDLSKDPCETNNLAPTQPDKARKMLAEYQEWAARVGVKEPKNGVKAE